MTTDRRIDAKEIKKRKIIFVVVFCTLITSSAQFLLKRGLDQFSLSIPAVITNYNIILGFVAYGVGALLFMYALKHLDLSVAYPIMSLSFVWVSLISVWFLSETLILLQWMGVLSILAGVSLIGAGDAR
jgi:drug/metabolite transporter (DMT)-like permease